MAAVGPRGRGQCPGAGTWTGSQARRGPILERPHGQHRRCCVAGNQGSPLRPQTGCQVRGPCEQGRCQVGQGGIRPAGPARRDAASEDAAGRAHRAAGAPGVRAPRAPHLAPPRRPGPSAPPWGRQGRGRASAALPARPLPWPGALPPPGPAPAPGHCRLAGAAQLGRPSSAAGRAFTTPRPEPHRLPPAKVCPPASGPPPGGLPAPGPANVPPRFSPPYRPARSQGEGRPGSPVSAACAPGPARAAASRPRRPRPGPAPARSGPAPWPSPRRLGGLAPLCSRAAGAGPNREGLRGGRGGALRGPLLPGAAGRSCGRKPEA